MDTDFERIETEELLALASGDPAQVERLRRPVRLAGAAPFEYPVKGPVVVFVTSDGTRVRMSEGGRLLRFLESQGMDPALDTVLSKTVFHALKDIEGAAAGNGEIFLDTTPDAAPAAVWRFLQLVLEVVGLRHSKYKDALVQLARAEGAVGLSWDDR
ncbi:MAG: DUF1828 domain-containing protein [Thermoleophilia bacterium]